VKNIAWKAQTRLQSRYTKLTARGKNINQTVTAVGRELLGFGWAIATRTEAKFQKQAAQVAMPCHSHPDHCVASPTPVQATLRLAALGLDGSCRRCRNAYWGEGMARFVRSDRSRVGGR
jgi:hypothetical protein